MASKPNVVTVQPKPPAPLDPKTLFGNKARSFYATEPLNVDAAIAEGLPAVGSGDIPYPYTPGAGPMTNIVRDTNLQCGMDYDLLQYFEGWAQSMTWGPDGKPDQVRGFNPPPPPYLCQQFANEWGNTFTYLGVLYAPAPGSGHIGPPS